MPSPSSSSSVATPDLGAASYAAARRVEQALGDPFDPESRVSFEAAVRADEEEVTPQAGFDALRELDVYQQIVPATEGGRLESFDDLLMLTRVVARRDPALSVGFGSTVLASNPIWLWGTADQRARCAEIVANGGFGTFAVSERAAGSDLAATQATATRTDSGFRLDAEKWMVGNARRAEFYVVLARSDPSFGLFLVDPQQVEKGTLTPLPRIPTHGLRGHDLSGVEFHGCMLGPDAPVGPVGRGIEIATTTLQYTRTMIAGMSLGVADSSLRIALRWALERRLYGAPIFDLPPIRRLLAGAFADLLISECVAISGARALNAAPHRTSLWSAIAKYLVPMTCEGIVRDCAEVLSARFYLREGVASGVFQKLARDVAIASIFEGTQLVQLEMVRTQLTHGMRRPRATTEEVTRSDLFAAGAPVTPWDPQGRRPRLSYGGTDEIVDGLDSVVEEVNATASADDGELGRLAARFLELRDAARRDLAALSADGSGRSMHGYELARRHCLLHAGACCLQMWLENRERIGGPAADGHWVAICLTRLLERLGEPWPGEPPFEDERYLGWLEQFEHEDRLFSLVPFELANSGSTGGES